MSTSSVNCVADNREEKSRWARLTREVLARLGYYMDKAVQTIKELGLGHEALEFIFHNFLPANLFLSLGLRAHIFSLSGL